MATCSFRVCDKDALQVDTCSPSLVPGSSISRNADAPDGTVYRFDDAYQSAVAMLNHRGGTDIAFEDENGAACVVENAGPPVLGGVMVEADSLQYIQEIDDQDGLKGPILTLSIFSRNGPESEVWGFHSNAPLVSGARYRKVGGNDAGRVEIKELSSSSEHDRIPLTSSSDDPCHAKTRATPKPPQYTFMTLSQSDLMRRVQGIQ